MQDKYAPIILFTYNRFEETKQTVAALQANFLAKESELFIFSDAAKDKAGIEKIEKVRIYLNTITGFKSVTIFESKRNKGLANSIIDGVSQILEQYETAIVLEDDLVSSPNFLDFMNQGLSFYKMDSNIFSISGYTLDLHSLKKSTKDYYYGYRASSWGWGLWANRWQQIGWCDDNYQGLLNDKQLQKKFNRGGSDMSNMLKKQLNGQIDSWAIRFCYHQFIHQLKTVFPTSSKINSIGFGDNATHTSGTKRFITKLDSSLERTFFFEQYDEMDQQLVKEFANKFSIKTRLIDKLKQQF
tara:strand:- start:698 stop:1594 length:897 start_codon:yes stop_codon:yes gene_type:complete